MKTYARIRDGVFDSLHNLTAEQYNALVENGKAVHLRLWIMDPEPVITATQVFQPSPIVITDTEAHQTWEIREKTPEELEAGDILVESSKIDEVLADLATQRAVVRATWDAHTAAQLRSEQWRDRQVLLRLATLVARRIKQEAMP